MSKNWMKQNEGATPQTQKAQTEKNLKSKRRSVKKNYIGKTSKSKKMKCIKTVRKKRLEVKEDEMYKKRIKKLEVKEEMKLKITVAERISE